MTTGLHARARKIRERELILKWEYRQRDHAKGTWFRLRRALVDAAEAWVIGPEDAVRLAAAGVVPLSVGGELDPPKRIFVVQVETLSALPSRRQIPVRLSVELLKAADIALVPFSDAEGTNVRT
jgi:hypothetical protein